MMAKLFFKKCSLLLCCFNLRFIAIQCFSRNAIVNNLYNRHRHIRGNESNNISKNKRSLFDDDSSNGGLSLLSRHHHHGNSLETRHQEIRIKTSGSSASSKPKSFLSRIDRIGNKRLQWRSYSRRSSLMTGSTSLKATSSEEIKAEKNNRRRKNIKSKQQPVSDEGSSSIDSRTGSSNADDGVTLEGGSRSTQNTKTEEHHQSQPPSNNRLGGGVARLSRAVAKASADREKAATGVQSESDLYISSINNQKNNNDNAKRDVGSLTELTRAIDEKLYANGPRGTDKGDYPKLDGVVQNARDNMISLLGFNHVQGDWKRHISQSTYNVAIVFGKRLVDDQVTVEYASRIKTLARLFKEEPEFRPSLVCFCGGTDARNHLSDADAGYVYFRHLCAAECINLENVGIFIDNKSQSDEEIVYHVTEEVKRNYAPKWLEASMDTGTTTDEFGEMGKEKTRINVHFTLISTEYHLCNINDVHHRSPQRSLLTTMELMGENLGNSANHHQHGFSHESPYTSQGGYFNGSNNIGHHNGYNNHAKKQQVPRTKFDGIVETSWSFQYATYPYICAKDDATVFLGKCYLLGEELMPLLVNMKGVVDQKEFFQRDNYLMLSSIRRSLVHHVEQLHKPRRMLKTSLKVHARNIYLRDGGDARGVERDMITVLEGALLSLGRCVDLVKPAGLLVSSVAKNDWIKALHSLEHSMSEIRNLCDPDIPLKPSEWGKLVDDTVVKS